MGYDLKYKYLADSNAYQVVGYIGKPIDVTINEFHDGKRIISIGQDAFANCSSLETISISEGVEIICMSAFENCLSLQTVDLPSTLKRIEWRAFHTCRSLNCVDFADGILEIEESAFTDCVSLTSIYLPKSIKKIDLYAFEGCSSLEAIRIDPNNEFYSSIDGLLCDKTGKTILYCPYGKSGIIDIPEGVTTIADDAFSNRSNIICVMIPNSISVLGKNAFYGCSNLEEITLPGDSIYGSDGKPFDCCSKLSEIHFTNATECISALTLKCFSRCYMMDTFYIPSNVSSIDFEGIASFPSFNKYVVDPRNNYFSVLNGALFDKKRTTLLSVPRKREIFEVPDCTTIIANSAFACCHRLKEIYVPHSVKEIQFWSFSGTKSLQKIIVSNANEDYASKDGILFNKNMDRILWWQFNNDTIRIPKGTVVLSSHLFDECTNTLTVYLPNSIKTIEKNCFKRYSSIKYIYYDGDSKDFKQIKCGQNWYQCRVTRIICKDRILPRSELR